MRYGAEAAQAIGRVSAGCLLGDRICKRIGMPEPLSLNHFYL
jgi:hypothetical protein